MKLRISIFCLLQLALWAFESNKSENIPQSNLIMIMFDDLRPELSIYGLKHMVTPNFERLASRSVVFDYAYAQVAVCNPSRDSLLTGLRPDTVGTYNFQHSFRPHLTLPTELGRSGYNTAGIGKLLHWDGPDKDIWNFFQWDNDWYKYQFRENNYMNSSAMPDKHRPESDFRDHQFAEKAIDTLNNLLREPKPFLLAVGFKLPHLALHVPYPYYSMYKNRTSEWRLSKKELRFPLTTPEIAYRCCAEPQFKFMRGEGALKANRTVKIGDINMAFTNEMRDELMMSYCGAITFVDKQLGKLLDVMDQRDLWRNTTVVLTADHGMHNGEKGIWHKWTLFEESTRVPLLIAHPLSPFKGEHYQNPVELVDVFATMRDLLGAPFDQKTIYKGVKHITLQGKSLAPIILGSALYQKYFPRKHSQVKYKLLPELSVNESDSKISLGNMMPVLERDYAFTQTARCAKKKDVSSFEREFSGKPRSKTAPRPRRVVWDDCNVDYKGQDEMSLLGYSIRTPGYRYTAYFHYNKTSFLGKQVQVDLSQPPFQQELYDHKNETLQDFTHRETVNLAYKLAYVNIVSFLKEKIIRFIRREAIFHSD